MSVDELIQLAAPIAPIAGVVLLLIVLIMLIVLLKKVSSGNTRAGTDEETKRALEDLSEKTRVLGDTIESQGRQHTEELSRTREDLGTTVTDTVYRCVTDSVTMLGNSLRDEQARGATNIENRLSAQNKTIDDRLSLQSKAIEERLSSQSTLLTQRLDKVSENLQSIQQTNHADMENMRRSNQESLDKINGTVSEKLQKTLDERINLSFEQVTQRLIEVNKGLGEMREVASGVTDLKKILANVKTRGVVGEYQLKAILDEILTPDQYEEQVPVKERSREKVDFAIKMPGASIDTSGEGHDFILLPIDAKFPAETYEKLVDAMESGSVEDVKAARAALETTVKTEAKSISEKYISVPTTTNFALMFFPFEGLYSEVINMPGLVSDLQEKYKVVVTGPSTMAALLNSLQMGFRTLEIQRKSSEVWKILEDAQREFENFEEVLNKTRDRLKQADDELEKLVGVRTRQINRALKDIKLVDKDDMLIGSSES